MFVLDECVVVAQGAILSGYKQERQTVVYRAHDVITCLAGYDRYIVVACSTRCLEVIDITSGICVGRYSTSSAIVDLTMDARLRILVHQADGSIALVLLDGLQR